MPTFTAAEITAFANWLSTTFAPGLAASGETVLASALTWVSSQLSANTVIATGLAAFITTQWANIPAETQALVSFFAKAGATVSPAIATLSTKIESMIAKV